ncbi:hypothetical protein BESB_080520 [Besnoitia besnoiti]|uniref:Uncharacterized protein n=1 Tax=Besnoitia besnoiti TaxID=94643 RepID=A0A2A9MD10_BESBE|nr:hypothetical protein BESB_080520 [Besnoitia besnoiti]PFH33836.1 hypothetical protein BESB_080520 [Besnoitia besnoiti]
MEGNAIPEPLCRGLASLPPSGKSSKALARPREASSAASAAKDSPLPPLAPLSFCQPRPPRSRPLSALAYHLPASPPQVQTSSGPQSLFSPRRATPCKPDAFVASHSLSVWSLGEASSSPPRLLPSSSLSSRRNDSSRVSCLALASSSPGSSHCCASAPCFPAPASSVFALPPRSSAAAPPPPPRVPSAHQVPALGPSPHQPSPSLFSPPLLGATRVACRARVSAPRASPQDLSTRSASLSSCPAAESPVRQETSTLPPSAQPFHGSPQLRRPMSRGTSHASLSRSHPTGSATLSSSSSFSCRCPSAQAGLRRHAKRLEAVDRNQKERLLHLERRTGVLLAQASHCQTWLRCVESAQKTLALRALRVNLAVPALYEARAEKQTQAQRLAEAVATQRARLERLERKHRDLIAEAESLSRPLNDAHTSADEEGEDAAHGDGEGEEDEELHEERRLVEAEACALQRLQERIRAARADLQLHAEIKRKHFLDQQDTEAKDTLRCDLSRDSPSAQDADRLRSETHRSREKIEQFERVLHRKRKRLAKLSSAVSHLTKIPSRPTPCSSPSGGRLSSSCLACASCTSRGDALSPSSCASLSPSSLPCAPPLVPSPQGRRLAAWPAGAAPRDSASREAKADETLSAFRLSSRGDSLRGCRASLSSPPSAAGSGGRRELRRKSEGEAPSFLLGRRLGEEDELFALEAEITASQQDLPALEALLQERLRLAARATGLRPAEERASLGSLLASSITSFREASLCGRPVRLSSPPAFAPASLSRPWTMPEGQEGINRHPSKTREEEGDAAVAAPSEPGRTHCETQARQEGEADASVPGESGDSSRPLQRPASPVYVHPSKAAAGLTDSCTEGSRAAEDASAEMCFSFASSYSPSWPGVTSEQVERMHSAAEGLCVPAASVGTAPQVVGGCESVACALEANVEEKGLSPSLGRERSFSRTTTASTAATTSGVHVHQAFPVALGAISSPPPFSFCGGHARPADRSLAGEVPLKFSFTQQGDDAERSFEGQTGALSSSPRRATASSVQSSTESLFSLQSPASEPRKEGKKDENGLFSHLARGEVAPDQHFAAAEKSRVGSKAVSGASRLGKGARLKSRLEGPLGTTPEHRLSAAKATAAAPKAAARAERVSLSLRRGGQRDTGGEEKRGTEKEEARGREEREHAVHGPHLERHRTAACLLRAGRKQRPPRFRRPQGGESEGGEKRDTGRAASLEREAQKTPRARETEKREDGGAVSEETRSGRNIESVLPSQTTNPSEETRMPGGGGGTAAAQQRDEHTKREAANGLAGKNELANADAEEAREEEGESHARAAVQQAHGAGDRRCGEAELHACTEADFSTRREGVSTVKEFTAGEKDEEQRLRFVACGAASDRPLPALGGAEAGVSGPCSSEETPGGRSAPEKDGQNGGRPLFKPDREPRETTFRREECGDAEDAETLEEDAAGVHANGKAEEDEAEGGALRERREEEDAREARPAASRRNEAESEPGELEPKREGGSSQRRRGEEDEMESEEREIPSPVVQAAFEVSTDFAFVSEEDRPPLCREAKWAPPAALSPLLLQRQALSSSAATKAEDFPLPIPAGENLDKVAACEALPSASPASFSSLSEVEADGAGRLGDSLSSCHFLLSSSSPSLSSYVSSPSRRASPAFSSPSTPSGANPEFSPSLAATPRAASPVFAPRDSSLPSSLPAFVGSSAASPRASSV